MLCPLFLPYLSPFSYLPYPPDMLYEKTVNYAIIDCICFCYTVEALRMHAILSPSSPPISLSFPCQLSVFTVTYPQHTRNIAAT